MALNFTLEVIAYAIAAIIMGITSGILLKRYIQVNVKPYLYLGIAWLFYAIYFASGSIAYLYLSLPLFQMHFIVLSISTFFLSLSIDYLNRYSLDPIKLTIATITSMGVLFSVFDPVNVIQYELSVGGTSFEPINNLFIWLILSLAQPVLYYILYCLLILKKSPKEKKRDAWINALAGILFTSIPFVLLSLGMGTIFPGIIIIPFSICAFLSSIIFYRSENILEIIRNASHKVKLKTILKILPICANCKNVRDDRGTWYPIEEFFNKQTNIHFTHGICEKCSELLYPEFEEQKEHKVQKEQKK